MNNNGRPDKRTELERAYDRIADLSQKVVRLQWKLNTLEGIKFACLAIAKEESNDTTN